MNIFYRSLEFGEKFEEGDEQLDWDDKYKWNQWNPIPKHFIGQEIRGAWNYLRRPVKKKKKKRVG